MTGQAGPAAVASRLVVGLAGPWPTPAETAWLERWRPAGVLLFARNVTDRAGLAALCRELRDRLPPGAEVMADHEGGPVCALAGALGRPPGAASLGLAGDPELTRRVHAETGRRLRDAGLARVLAPCADVLVEPRNPVIGGRAFGADAALVADQVVAAVSGLREGGVRTCLKHWPGHGGTAADSHDTAVVDGGGAVATPFVAGLAAGADAVMVGHVPDPVLAEAGVTPATPTPATLAPAAIARLRGLAREPLLVFADDVTMGALRAPLAARGIQPLSAPAAGGLVDPADLPPAWLTALAEAGCDRLLCRGIPWRAFLAPAEVGRSEGARPSAAQHGAAVPTASGAPAVRSTVASAGADRRAEVPAVYGEARRRAALAAGGDPFPPAAGRLVWLDLTVGDRWGEADCLLEPLRERFCGVTRVGGAPAAAPDGSQAQVARCLEGAAALLVTSHRPLAPAWQELLAAAPWGAEGGGLALGHPDLAALLRAALPAGWRRTAAPELSLEMLAAILAARPEVRAPAAH